MSVDFFDCPSCGDSICECGEFHYCTHCDRQICINCLVSDNRYDDNGDPTKECCPFCSGTQVHNDDLLSFILGKYGLTMKAAVTMYKEAMEYE